MSKLQYLTRGSASPQGKPRVYFCGHHKEQEFLLKPISQQILELQNCAIWYDTESEDPCNWKELSADLSQMQMFVMPVTERLLTQPNRAMDKEFPFAIKHHIPVLPLMQESDLHFQFQERFGDLQFLDATAHDSAGIPFKEKLQKFLHSILIDDELTEKVRAAFDEDSLLSYQENHNAAQHNYFIGLAYLSGIDVEIDRQRAEALIRGAAEQGYEPAMEKLVSMYRYGEGIKRDYLKVIDWQKKLVESREKAWKETQTEDTFVKLTDTLWDLRDFYKKLEGIPAKRWIWENKMLPLCKTAWENNGFSKARIYTIVCYESLGNRCNERGEFSEARKYYELALKMNKQLAEEEPTIKNRHSLSVSYKRLGDICRDEDDLQEAHEYYELALEISKQLAKEDPNLANRWDLSISYERIGHLYDLNGDWKKCWEFCKIGYEIYKQLTQKELSFEGSRDFPVGYECIDSIHMKENDPKALWELYELEVDIFKQVTEELPIIESRWDLIESYEKMSDILMEECDLLASLWYDELILEIYKQMDEEFPDQENCLFDYYKKGTIYEMREDLQTAQKYYQLDLDKGKRLVEKMPTIQNLANLSAIYFKLGNISQLKENLSDSRKYYEHALEISKQINEEFSDGHISSALILRYERMGDICQMEGNLPEARGYYEAAFELGKQIMEKLPEGRERDRFYTGFWLFISYEKLGDICRAEGDFEAARQFYELAVKFGQLLDDDFLFPLWSIIYLFFLFHTSDMYHKLGDICTEKEDLEEAEKFYELGLQFNKQAEEIKSCLCTEDLYNRCSIFMQMASSYKDEGNLQAARNIFEFTSDIYKQLTKKDFPGEI